MLNLRRNKIKKELAILFFLTTFCLLFLSVSPAGAIRAELDWPEVGGIKIEEGGSLVATLPQLVQYFFNFAIAIGGIAAFAMLVLGGFRFLTSAGNPTSQKDAKDIITSAVIGLLLLLSSYLLLQVINPDILTLKDIGL
ncbi:MAG: hypothetical protein Q8P08_01880 [bacterium]|nr:hypothetical protein [bacterium]